MLAPTHACTTANAWVNYTGSACHRNLANFPSPPWETHVCLVVCRVAVLLSLPAQSQSSTPKCIPIKLPMCALMLNSSHRPEGRLTFCSLFAGRWCPCWGWHSVNRELPDLLQHSFLCAHSSSKLPIAPMGTLLTCLPRLTLAQLRTLRSTKQAVRAAENLKKVPIAPLGDSHVLLVDCRAAVSSSLVAQ